MSYDRYSSLYHLTSNGWVGGDERPSNAIETWVCDVDQPSAWSKETRDWTCKWVDPSVDRATRDEVREKYKEKAGMVDGTFGDVRISVGKPL